MVGLDVLIEPVAIDLSFWTWTNPTVPLSNYLAWFLTAFLMGLVFNFLSFNKNNSMAWYVFGIQILFFTLCIIFK